VLNHDLSNLCVQLESATLEPADVTERIPQTWHMFCNLIVIETTDNSFGCDGDIKPSDQRY